MIKKLFKGDNIYAYRYFGFTKPYRFRYWLTMFLYSSQGFMMQFILAMFTGNIMAAILAGDAGGVTHAGVTLAIMLGVYLLIFGIGIFVHIVTVGAISRDVRQKLFRSFVADGLESDKHSGESIAALNTDASTAEDVLEGPLMMFLYNLMIIPASIVVVFVIDWRLGLAVTAVGMISFFVQHRFTEPLAKIGKDRLDANAENVKTGSNIFAGAITIRAYNMQPEALISYDRENNRLQTLDIKQGIISMWQGIFGSVEGWLTMLVVFGLGGWLASTGHLEFSSLIVVFMMGGALANAIGSMGRVYADMQPPIAGAKRLFMVMDKADAHKKDVAHGDGVVAKGYAIDVKNLSFRYKDAETETLKNVSFNIPENKTVAFVGESGSGKSTLLKVLIGLYDRDEMGLFIGDVCFNDMKIAAWREQFAYVDQSCKLFDMSVRENIAMGKAGAVTETWIISAAKRAAAHEFIETLDGGYDADCGEKGGQLSGGQKQRIAIARAIYKRSPVLVFDEATSALDKESERHVMNTIEDLRKDHTILLTTHNLENVKTADMIVVMDQGNVAEIGTHHELMEKQGIYHRLVMQ